jgi:transposase, IS30 family
MAFFTLERRYTLAGLCASGLAAAEMARHLGCCERTVVREIGRCAGQRYDAGLAQRHREHAQARSAANVVVKIKDALLAQLYALFTDRLRLSPEEVSLTLARLPKGRGHRRYAVSTPALYSWLARERTLEPQALLWPGRSGMRASARHGACGKKRGWAATAQSIEQRPEIGHVECDLMTGRQRDRFRLLVTIDRKTRLVRLAKPRLLATQTAEALRTLLEGTGLKTLTSDRGTEFARLPRLFKEKFYVCHAYRADERGSCEHVIRWLREFFPKGQTLDPVTDEYVKELEDIINRRPRKIFGGLSPFELHFPSPRSQTVRT